MQHQRGFQDFFVRGWAAHHNRRSLRPRRESCHRSRRSRASETDFGRLCQCSQANLALNSTEKSTVKSMIGSTRVSSVLKLYRDDEISSNIHEQPSSGPTKTDRDGEISSKQPGKPSTGPKTTQQGDAMSSFSSKITTTELKNKLKPLISSSIAWQPSHQLHETNRYEKKQRKVWTIEFSRRSDARRVHQTGFCRIDRSDSPNDRKR